MCRVFFAIIFLSITAFAGPVEDTLRSLIEDGIVGDDELMLLIESIDGDAPKNPICDELASTSLEHQLAQEDLNDALQEDDVDWDAVRTWANDQLDESKRVEKKRCERREETRKFGMPYKTMAGSRLSLCAINSINRVVCVGNKSGFPLTDLGEVIEIGHGQWNHNPGFGEHYCALRLDGIVRCWGKNMLSSQEYPFGKTKIKHFRMSEETYVNSELYKHMNLICGIKLDNRVICNGPHPGQNLDNLEALGSINYLAIRKGDIGVVSKDGQVMLSNKFHNDLIAGDVVSRAITFSALFGVCVIRLDNTVHCYDPDQMKKIYSYSTKMPEDMGPVKWFSDRDGQGGICAIKDNNNIACWQETEGDLRGKQDFGLVRELLVRSYGLCAITMDNKLKCHMIEKFGDELEWPEEFISVHVNNVEQ